MPKFPRIKEKSIIVRRATAQDAAAITTLYIYNWNNTYKELVSEDQKPDVNYASRKEKILKKLTDEHYLFLVCEFVYNKRKELAGMIYAGPNKYYPNKSYEICIESLYIYPCYAGQGIGSFLFKSLLHELNEIYHIPKVMLWCIKENYTGINFYKKHQGIMISDVETPKEFLGTESIVFVWDLKKK